MKPFKINRNSWHYKMNTIFFNEYQYSMERNWEPRHNNFCSYWRATFFRIVFITMFASFIFALLSMMVLFITMFASFIFDLLSMMVLGTIANPMAALAVLGVILAIIALIVGGVLAHTGYTAYAKKNADKPDSLFVQRYKAYKSKVCPMVEYDE